MVVDAITREVSVPQGVDWLWPMVSEGHGLASWLCDAGAEVDLLPGGWVSLRWQGFRTFARENADGWDQALANLRRLAGERQD